MAEFGSGSSSSSSSSSILVFYVNQVKVVESNANPEETLISYLRRKLHLTGTKLACGEGGCGACTVMVSRYHRRDCRIVNASVNACLTPVCSVHGAAVTTVEGISGSGALHPLQQRLAACHGSQCGFCTPGMLMTAYSLLRSCCQPTERQLQEALQGNLCRCTGYRPIIEAFTSFTSGCCGRGSSCCRSGQADSAKTTNASDFLPYDPSQEPIFPSELQLKSETFDSQELRFSSEFVTWHRPTNLRSLLLLKREIPDAKIVNGNTEIGVEVKSKKVTYPHLIHAAFVDELQELSFCESGVTIGSGVTLTTVMTRFREELLDEGIDEGKRRTLEVFVDTLHNFAGLQIRNVASVGGNVMTASPISDLNPVLMACGAQLTFESLEGGRRSTPMTPSFFPSYRKTATQPQEVLVSVFVPFCHKREFLVSMKQSKRRDDDIAIVNLTMRVRFEEKDVDRVAEAAVCCGGMAETTAKATKTEATMKGRSWRDCDLLSDSQKSLGEDFPLQVNAPGGQVAYRMTLVASLLVRCFHKVGVRLSETLDLSNCYADATFAERLTRGLCTSSQVFEVSDRNHPVGQPIGHVSGQVQALGAAEFVDDMPEAGSEIFACPVLSNCATGYLEGLDFSDAADLPGVVGFVSHKDVPGCNSYGPEIQDDRIFVDDDIRFEGDVVAAVVAVDREVARRAAQRVRPIVRSSSTKPLITISDAVAAGSFFDKLERRLVEGDASGAIESRATHEVSGEFRMEGQEHFYFEPQTCLAVPKDGCRELVLHASTQNPSHVQRSVAKAINLPCSQVSVKVKRIGGGFGGKELRCVGTAGIAAVAAKKFNRPVRIVLDREDDMAMTGTRHPMLAKYRAGIDADGRLVGLIVDILLNGGFSSDVSAAVGQNLILRLFSGYRVPACDCRVRICRTNTLSCTACRGSGTPQALGLMETVMARLAEASGMSGASIREVNLVDVGDVSPYGQEYEDPTVRRCWNECRRLADFDRRLQEIREFNQTAGCRSRGLAITPVHYGIGFSVPFLHQAGAIVNIYLDGSVLVTHAGVEMGQGLHTKLLQVASNELQLPMESIFVAETSTDTLPNSTPSSASVTTDLNAPAVMDACRQLLRRLAPFREANPDGRWLDWVTAAYTNGVSLSACGFFHGPESQLDSRTMRGHAFIYFTSGAACSEVEIDALTGELVIRRVDIVMDVGESLNPAVDIGQIEGAFVQGCGLFTLEEHRFSPSGRLLTRGPSSYKIPGFGDVPEHLRIHLLSDSRCRYKRAVHSSKAVGEPPLCLATSVFVAARSAVAAARERAGSSDATFRFDSPATCERIRMATGDSLAQTFAAACSSHEGQESWDLKLAE